MKAKRKLKGTQGAGGEGEAESTEEIKMSLDDSDAQEIEKRLKILNEIFADIKKRYFPRIPSYQIQIAQLKDDWRGCCDSENRLITISPDVPVDEYRSIMFHEMAHHVRGEHGKPMLSKLMRAKWRALDNGAYEDAVTIEDEIYLVQDTHKSDREKHRQWSKEQLNELLEQNAKELAAYNPSVPGSAPQVLRGALDNNFGWLDTGWVRILGKRKPLAWLVDKLRNCTDLAPDNLYCGLLDHERNRTYGQFVKKLEAEGYCKKTKRG